MDCLKCHAPFEGSPQFCPNCGASTLAAAKSATATAPATEQDPRFDPFVGQLVGGRYRVTRLLGEGGMGAVYVGEQNIGGTVRKVAIKTLHAHISKDPRVLQRFERECATVAELQHPNTIQIYDFGKTEDGILYMVMEYVQGESLASALEKNGFIEPMRTQHIIQQICDALGEAHRLGIVHRDLKPENVLLTERAKDWVKVLDFGIAKRTEDQDAKEAKLTQQGTVLGTPPYMSPEQFTGRPIDARSDIYSIAIMAYEMLAGRLPFTAATPWEWATKHMTTAPMPLSVTPLGAPIPEVTAYAIMRALSKDPADRFATTRELFEAMAVPLPGYEGLAVSGGYASAPMSMLSGQSAFSVGPPLAAAAGIVAGGTAPIAVPGYVVAPLAGTTPGGVPQAGGPVVGSTPMSGAPLLGSMGPTAPIGGPPRASSPAANPLATTTGGSGKGNTQVGDVTAQPGGSAPPTVPAAGGGAAYGPPGGAVAFAGPPYGAAGGAMVPPVPGGVPRRSRGGGGAVIAVLAVGGLLAAGGIVFAVTRPSKHARHDPPSTRTTPTQDTTGTDDAGQRATNDFPSKEHLPPLIDTALPSLPINTDPLRAHVDAGGGGSADPHACHSARSLQAKINKESSPSPKLLANFNHERAKCIEAGGHL